MSSLLTHPGFELVWVNASPKGPTQLIRSDPQHYFVMRIPLGKSKTVSRSNADTTYAPVNDLDDSLFFPGAKVVSRNHATFEWQGDRLIIKDNGSTHGTFVAHQQAKFYPDDQFNQGHPHAVKKRVDGIMELQEGDLIEFGKDCHRTSQSYHPVRCYLRAVRQPTSTASTTSPKKSSAISVVDDLFDSDSDIISVAADTMNRCKQTPPPAVTVETVLEIVDLTSDDEEDSAEDSHDTNFGDSTFRDQSSDGRNDTHSDAPIPHSAASASGDSQSAVSETHKHNFTCPIAGASDESDSSSDEDVDSFDFSQVPWRKEVDEVAREQVELRREDQDARSQGECYLWQYKNAHPPETEESGYSSYKTAPEEPYSPATSAAADDTESPSRNAAKNKLTFDPESLCDRLVEDAITEAIAAVPTQTVEASAQSKVEQPSPSPLKRKLDIEDLRDSNNERTEQVSASVSTSATRVEASSLTNESDSNVGSNPLTPSPSDSTLPSPSKKRRVDHPHAGRAPTRARKIRAVAAKAIQATSLLSFGFLAGSLFTFKSMMNAAAAANAAGSSK